MSTKGLGCASDLVENLHSGITTRIMFHVNDHLHFCKTMCYVNELALSFIFCQGEVRVSGLKGTALIYHAEGQNTNCVVLSLPLLFKVPSFIGQGLPFLWVFTRTGPALSFRASHFFPPNVSEDSDLCVLNKTWGIGLSHVSFFLTHVKCEKVAVETLLHVYFLTENRQWETRLRSSSSALWTLESSYREKKCVKRKTQATQYIKLALFHFQVPFFSFCVDH